MSQYKMILTDIGQATIADAIANNTTVKLDTFAVGDGDGFSYTPDASMIKLVNEKWRGRIEQVSAEQNNQRKIVATIPSDIGGFFMREIGVFDENGVLIAVGNTVEQYKPLPIEGMAKAIKLGLIIKVENANAIELIVNEDLQAATKQDVTEALNAHIQKTNPHNVTKAQIGLGNVNNTSDADKPISTATASVLAGKADANSLAPIYEEIDNIEQRLTTHVGDVNELQTTNKQIVAAINEVKQDGNNVKSNTVSALLSKDGSLPITQNSAWQDVIASIDGLNLGIDTSDATALASHLLSGLTAYANGQKITGTMPNHGAHMNATGTAKWGDNSLATYFPSGYYGGGMYGGSEVKTTPTQLQQAEPHLIPGHILSGASIFGINGDIPNYANAANEGYIGAQSIKGDGHGSLVMAPPRGYYEPILNGGGYGALLAHDHDYVASNIRAGVDIFGVVGSLESQIYTSGQLNTSGGILTNNVRYSITGLNFTPKIIFVMYKNTSGGWTSLSSILVFNGITHRVVYSPYAGNIYITANGFNYDHGQYNTTISETLWVAFK